MAKKDLKEEIKKIADKKDSSENTKKEIKEKKKIKIVKGDESLARIWLTQSESDFRDRLTRFNEEHTKRLERVVPMVTAEASQTRVIQNLPLARQSPTRNGQEEAKYLATNEDPLVKKYFSEKSPAFYTVKHVDVTRIGREKNEFGQDTFIRKSEAEVGRGSHFDNYVAPQRTDTTSLGRKDPFKRDEPAYRTKLPSS